MLESESCGAVCRARMEEESQKLERRIEEVRNEKDSVQQEMENVKIQLHLAEDKSDNLNNQLHETIRKLKEGVLF